MKNNINNFTAAMQQYTHPDMMNSCLQTRIPARSLSPDSSEMAVGGSRRTHATAQPFKPFGKLCTVQYKHSHIQTCE